MNYKIQNDINELLEEKVISNEIASKIEQYYSLKKINSPNKLFTVFAVLGSTLVGLGIILILAHNWDDFSKTIKTVFAFLPLIIGQIIAGYAILKNKSKTWKEASGVFLFFAVGSSMAMVGQIYNIPGALSNYLLTWGLLCLPLMFILRSSALVVLQLVLATYYACDYSYFHYNFHRAPWWYLLFLIAVLSYYGMVVKRQLKTNIESILNWLIPISLIIVLGAFVNVLMYVFLFSIFYNFGKLPYFDKQQLRRNGFLVLGSLGTVFMLSLASFGEVWGDLDESFVTFDSQESYVGLTLFLLTLCLLPYSKIKRRLRDFNLFKYGFVFFAIIFFIGLKNNVAAVILVHLLVLILGVTAIKIGAEKLHFGIVNYGLLIITILITCRFFDTDISFVIRGLVFVIVGVGFFLTNYIILKRQKFINNKKN